MKRLRIGLPVPAERKPPSENHVGYNIIISAALSPNGNAAKAVLKALSPSCEPIVCDYIIDELHRKFEEKFPHRIIELEAFLYNALKIIRIVPTPENESITEETIRDIKDRPILRAALAAGTDYLLTGDKDFLESGITTPINDYRFRISCIALNHETLSAKNTSRQTIGRCFCVIGVR